MAERIVDINNRDEFVDALAALLTSDVCHAKHKSGCLAPDCRECIDRFFNVHSHLLPEIDVEPLTIYAEWVYSEDGYAHCSECGFETSDISRFCPDCGAAMESMVNSDDE